ncbi:uncharacterized protein LOC142563353 [Dermacentor variabilis]|uniref:uncharacterized protein LOC142563353 n=1 Tax=Dermacentor variabilis TaxID=34621 RepID=UPI003F5AE546
MDIVRKTAPDALVDDDKQEQVSVALGTLDPTEFPGMFEALERSLRRLGIAGMGVTVATMKDVYLKINLGWAPGGKARESAVEGKDIDAVCKPITKERTGARSFGALFAKRLLSLARSWDLFFFFFLLPLALLALDSWRSNPQNLLLRWNSAAASADVPIKLGAHFPESVVVLGESPPTNVSQRLRALVESEGCGVRSAKDVRKELRDSIEDDLHSYITTYSMGVAFESNVIRMIPNPTSDVTLPIIVNLVGTAWLRALTAQPTAQFNVTVTFLKYSRVWGEALVLASRFVAWYYWMVVPSLTYSLGFAAYGSFPVTERLSGARDVQLMTGIPGLEFVFAHFAFDFLYHVFFSVSWCAVHYSFGHYSAATFGMFLLVFLFFGPLAIALGYWVAEYSLSSGAAVIWIFIALYIGGWVTATLGFFVWIFVSKETVHYVSLLAPPYALLSALVKVWNDEEKQLQCKLLGKSKVLFNKGP